MITVKHILLFTLALLIAPLKVSGENLKRPEEPDISTIHDHYGEEGGTHNEDFDHEAVLGSDDEVDRFKEMPPEEAKERLGKLVDQMDENHDGFVSREELRNWIINSFKKLDATNAKAKFTEHDINKNGLVNFDEYAEKAYGYNKKELEDVKKDTSQEMKDFLQIILDDELKFKLADINHDGDLTAEEYIAFVHPQNYMHMAEYERTTRMKDYDSDKDGLISLQEYYGPAPLDDETKKSETEQFKVYDKDQNGFLDKDEVIDWFMPGFESTANSEVDHLVSETDTNKDNLLSKEEIVDQHELWVGSQATNFGEHLENHDEL